MATHTTHSIAIARNKSVSITTSSSTTAEILGTSPSPPRSHVLSLSRLRSSIAPTFSPLHGPCAWRLTRRIPLQSQERNRSQSTHTTSRFQHHHSPFPHRTRTEIGLNRLTRLLGFQHHHSPFPHRTRVWGSSKPTISVAIAGAKGKSEKQ